MTGLFEILIGIPITLLALSMHELAHGWVSFKLGDPTPKWQGRLTLNPKAHLDFVGTIMMIFFRFGWAKPVQINSSYYKNQTTGIALTALAGPVMNFLLGLAGGILGTFLTVAMLKFSWTDAAATTYYITQVFVIRNICFAVFNIIPFPPLDGFKVAGVLFPQKFYYTVLKYERYIIWILILLCFTGLFGRIITVPVSYLTNKILELAQGMFGFLLKTYGTV